MALQNRARRVQLVALRQRQGMQQVIGVVGQIAFEIPLQEDQCPFRLLIQQGRRRGEAQNEGVVGMGAQRFFGQLAGIQKSFPDPSLHW